MIQHRFYAGETLATVRAGEEIELVGATAHRLANVLRLQSGARVGIFGGGREFAADLEKVGRRVRVRLVAELPPLSGELQRLTLYQSLIRPQRFEWLIEKGTELGVTAFAPVLTERAAVRAAEIGSARLERWERIAVEATEQSRGSTPPAILPLMGFDEALRHAGPGAVVAWEQMRTPPLTEELARLRAHAGTGLALFVGPEGGFSDAEVGRARTAGAVCIGLGPRTLRAETAAIVASTLLLLG